MIHPFVEVSFQKSSARTTAGNGTSPTWNQELSLPVQYEYQNKFAYLHIILISKKNHNSIPHLTDFQKDFEHLPIYNPSGMIYSFNCSMRCGHEKFNSAEFK